MLGEIVKTGILGSERGHAPGKKRCSGRRSVIGIAKIFFEVEVLDVKVHPSQLESGCFILDQEREFF